MAIDLSYQRLFSCPRALLFAIVIFAVTGSEAFGVTAESSASVSWATAFSAFPAATTIYNAGEDLLSPAQSATFNVDPSNSVTQGLNFGDAETGASALADSSLLLAESHASNGTAVLSLSIFSVLQFEGLVSGLLSLTIPYTLSTLVQPCVGSSTVTVFASLDIIDFLGNSTPAVTPEPTATLDDSGLGSPNDLTGVLSLAFSYDENTDLAAVLNIGIVSESTATPIKSVPIPGGIALAIPALLPLFASRKKRHFNRTT